MKRSLVTLIVVLVMLTMFVGTVAAAPLAAGTATLVSVVYVPGKGPVFTFEVSGKFTNADLKGALHIEGGDDFDLHCDQVDSTTVKCTASKKAAGKNVVLSWGGATYWASVPSAPAEFCYDVYDWNYPNPYTDWVNYGSVCQIRPASYGDVIEWYNPVWDDTFIYEYLPESPDALTCSFPPVSEDAYYYPFCPL